jgi:hypothetical protein
MYRILSFSQQSVMELPGANRSRPAPLAALVPLADAPHLGGSVGSGGRRLGRMAGTAARHVIVGGVSRRAGRPVLFSFGQGYLEPQCLEQVSPAVPR